MKKKSQDFMLEPKKHLKNITSVISWQKVLGFSLTVVFFANLGIYIYDKKNPTETKYYEIDEVVSPFTGDDNLTSSPFTTSKLAKSYVSAIDTNPDVDGVFQNKTTNGKNLNPIAKAKIVTSGYTETYYAGDTIFLSAMDSYDPDGTIVDYRWDFDLNNGLGTDAVGATATTTFKNEGIYTITLMVVDNNGGEATTSLVLNILEKPEVKENNVLALNTNLIDFDSLNFTSRVEIQNAVESSFADLQSRAVSNFAQVIYSSQKKNLPALPTLDEIELSVGNDPTNTPPTVDSISPKEGAEVFEQKPIISAGFYGSNEIDVDGIELLVDGVAVTDKAIKSKFGINYTPAEDMPYGTHSAMLVLTDSRNLKTTKTWSFKIVDPKAENDSLVPKYEDTQGPKIILHSPDKNAKNVTPSTDIKINFDEPVDPSSAQVAVVDLSTNITKFFSGTQIEWNSTYTGLVVSGNQNIFDYDTAYQIVVKVKDSANNESTIDWFIMGEDYVTPDFTITSPSDNSAVNQPKITVKGYADPSYRITVAGIVAMVDAAGSFEAEVPLTLGENEILITSKDLNGKETSQTLNITYDPKASGGNPIYVPEGDSPIIMDASIKDGQVIKSIRPQISFVFADTDGIDIKSVVLKVDGVDVTQFAAVTNDGLTYKPLEELAQGEHTVQLIVADKLGNTTNYNMTFTIDAYPESPIGLKASLTNNNESVLLLWDSTTNISYPEYRVYRSLNPNVDITASNEVSRNLKETKFQDDNVMSGSTYYYVVVAVNDAGNLSVASNEVKIRVDSTPPILDVQKPLKGQDFPVPTTTVSGVTDKLDIDTLEIYVNFKLIGEASINSDGTFSMEVPLVVGENIITTIATDADGNESVDVRTVTYTVPDTIPPEVTFKSPMGTDVSVSENIVITYSEPIEPKTFKMIFKSDSDPKSVPAIDITNICLQVSDDKKTFTYNPPEDLAYLTTYTVDVKAYDLAGNESIGDDWSFKTGDKEAPKLEIITPAVNYVSVDEYLYVSGNTEPNIDVAISVNGKLSDPVIKSSGNGYFSKLIQLQPGSNIITVVATDHLKHQTTVTVPGVYDAPDLIPPELIVDTPVQNAVIDTAKTTVSGYTEPGASLTISVNGKDQGTVTVKPNGSFSHKVELLAGSNLIKIVSTDAAGNQTPVAITVIYDDKGPLLEVANPIDGFTTNVGRLEVRGLTDVGSKVTISINGTQYTAQVKADGSFTRFINLSTFNNILTIVSEDLYGNETTIIRTVYYDPVGGSDGTLTGTGNTNGNSANSNSNANGVDGSGVADSGNSSSENTTDKPNLENQEDNKQENNNQPDNNKPQTDNSETPVIPSQEENKPNIEQESVLKPENNSDEVSSLGGTTDVIDPSTGEQNYKGGDNQPPELSISSSKGLLTSTPQIVINGQTEPEAKINVFQNGKQVSSGESNIKTGKFNASVVLAEGKNNFIVTASDVSGNKTTKNLTVELDTTPPHIQTLAPLPNTIINTSTYTVTGTTEKNTKVEVSVGSGKKTTGTSDELGRFSIKAPVGADGETQVTITATDALGNKLTKTVDITIDKTKSELQLLSINGVDLGGKTSKNPYGSTVMVADTKGTISGITEPYDNVTAYYNGVAAGRVQADVYGKFRVDVPLNPNGTDGVTNISVESKDKAGNVNTLYFRVQADTLAPTVTLIVPNSSTELDAGTINMKGYVSDDSFPVEIVIGINDETNVYTKKIQGEEEAEFTFAINAARYFKEGPNTIHIYSKDKLGNSKREKVYVMHTNRHDKPITAIVEITGEDKENALNTIDKLLESLKNAQAGSNAAPDQDKPQAEAPETPTLNYPGDYLQDLDVGTLRAFVDKWGDSLGFSANAIDGLFDGVCDILASVNVNLC